MRICALPSTLRWHHAAIRLRILRISAVGLCVLRPSLRLLRISILPHVSLSGITIWLLGALCVPLRHLRQWHVRLLLRNRLLNRLWLGGRLRHMLRHWLRLCRLLQRRRGLLCLLGNLCLLRLDLFRFLHHCEKVTLSRQLFLFLKLPVDCLQIARFGVLACLCKRIYRLPVLFGSDKILRFLEILLILLALLFLFL